MIGEIFSKLPSSMFARVTSTLRPVQRLGGGAGMYKFVPVLGGDGTK